MQKILKTYLKRLTNLSSTNKSLLLLNLPAEQFFDLHELNFLNGKPSFDIIGQLIAGKNNINLCDFQDSRFDKVNEASRKLKKIHRTEQFIEEERGSRDLYVGYPVIRGKLSDGSLIRCPLLFFPVQLALQSSRWVLSQREEEPVSLNKSFLLAYAHFNQTSISDEWIDKGFEEFPSDSLSFRTQLYELLKESPLEINFNKELFNDTLQTFERFTKADFESTQRTGELKLFPEAVLGIFPQASSYLVPDYQHLLQNNEEENPESFFLSQYTSPTQNILVKEEHTFTPFAIDASQENALKAIKKGHSMVVQGPPGTGKSQLICNLIADFIARGKNVLLVCQKRIALDVVYKRMKEADMTPFVALVHDYKSDRKAVYEQITTHIDNLEAYKEQNSSLDAIFMERTFLQESRKIDRITQELEEFRFALFDTTESGMSVKELYLTSDPSFHSIPLSQAYDHFPFTIIDHYIQQLSYYEAYATPFEEENYLWKNRVSFKSFTYTDLKKIIEVVSQIPVFQEEVSKATIVITGKSLSIRETEKLKAKKEILEKVLYSIKNQAQWELFLEMQEGKASARATDQEWLQAKEQELFNYLGEEGIEKSLLTENLEETQLTVKKAIQARGNGLSWLIWQLFSPHRKSLHSLAETNGLLLTKHELPKLSQKITNRLKAEQLVQELNAVKNIPISSFDQAIIETWFKDQYQAIIAFNFFQQSEWLKDYPSLLPATYAGFQEKAHTLFDLWDEMEEKRSKWEVYLTPQQIEQILEHPAQIDELTTTIQKDFDSICEIDRIKAGMNPVEKSLTEQLWSYYSTIPTEEKTDSLTLVAIFENSIRLAWIEHIENKYPILRGASTLKLEQLEKALQESVLKKMQLSKDITSLHLRDQTYREIELNRLKNVVTYRELKHQTSKKRKIWQMRKLLTAFSDEIFRLIPCWMASPEAVSAIFQIEKIFDLVIFDEASQCFAEKGIPAMYRGRQIVVTGDSKQLSPSDLYRIRFEEESENTPELEIDSLLDFASQYFPQTQLCSHYRSKSLELIDFSNGHFYNNMLKLLPDRYEVNKAEPAIRYIKVDGLWENNVNVTEAEAVVSLISKLVGQFPQKNIGVVTFNFKQQNLIQDLLEEAALEKGITWPETLFIKNIENVQGDERDIIIFSVGYAPDPKGKLAMQFGSLNMQGGENRLNVAVTRACEQIYVISSIYPAQLKTEETLHRGPKLFKQYLAYALQVSEGKYTPSPEPPKGFKDNQLLKNKLICLHNDFYKELPFADITVKDGKTYQSLILTDDDLYYQSLSPKDSYAYTPFLLSKKNWPFSRIYSREYWNNKEKVKNLVESISEA